MQDHVGAGVVLLRVLGVLPNIRPAKACLWIEDRYPAAVGLCQLPHQALKPIAFVVVLSTHDLHFVTLGKPGGDRRAQVRLIPDVAAEVANHDVGAGTHVSNGGQCRQGLLMLLQPDLGLPVALEALVLHGAKTIAHVVNAQQNAGDGLSQQSRLALDGIVDCTKFRQLKDLLHLLVGDVSEDLSKALLSNHLGFAVVDASQQVDCGVPLVHVSHGSELPLYSGPKCVLARDAGSDLAVAVEDHRQDNIDDHQADHDDHQPNPNRCSPPVLLGDDIPVGLERHHLLDALAKGALHRREVLQLGAKQDVSSNDKGTEDEKEDHEQVHNVLESHLQRVGQQSQAWLALGGHQELEEQENVEEGDAHQKVTVSAGCPVHHFVQQFEPAHVKVFQHRSLHIRPLDQVILHKALGSDHLHSLHEHEDHDDNPHRHNAPLDVRGHPCEVMGSLSV
mmetsp:Transcript_44520/g.105971  ORF Transcript_44520/g.105971 Transcript_44520/m.105971 type:complete len:449 (+) Transcript_44520:945-2291(+)